MSKSVEQLFSKLNSVVDQLRLHQGRQVSMNQALRQLIESMRLEPSDLSWSWRITETDFKRPKRRILKESKG